MTAPHNLSFGRIKNALWFLLLTAASVLSINQYRFGIDDHSTILAFIKESVAPRLYPGDIFLEQRHFFYTMLWTWLGEIHRFTRMDLPLIFFLTYCAVVLIFFYSIFRFARVLFKNQQVPYLAAFLFVFCTESIGSLGILENILLNRVAALPVALLSFSFFAEGRLKTAMALQGFAFYLQPVSALHAVVICVLAWLWRYRLEGLKALLPAVLILGIVASPMLFWRLTQHPDIHPVSMADPFWVELLRLRVSHHAFPLNWDPATLIRLLFFLLLFLKIRTVYPDAGEPQKRIFTACGIILFLCVFYTLFTEWLPVPGVFIFRWIRSYTYFIVFTVLFLSDTIVRKTFEKPDWSFVFWTAVSIGLFYETRKGWPVHYAVFACVVLAIGLYRRRTSPEKIQRLFVPVFAGLLVFLSVLTYAARIAAGQKNFTVQNAQETAWLKTQKWAYRHTDFRDAFIVPPLSEGFRVESERPIYADWKDGALSTYDPAYGKIWLRRMKTLGLNTNRFPVNAAKFNRAFLDLRETDFLKIAEEIRNEGAKVYLVGFAESRFDFPVRYENNRYKIYELPS